MPAVSVLSLRSTIGSSHHTTEARLLESMVDGMPDVDSVQHEPDNNDDSVNKPSADQGQHKEESKVDRTRKPSDAIRKESSSTGGTISPSQSTSSYPQGLPPHLTPQQPGYYVAYQSQVTPEPPSPAGPGATVYDVGSFLQQPTGFSPFTAVQYAGGHIPTQRHAGHAPQSPSQSSIPPASPLFPRIAGPSNGLLDPNRMLDGPSGQQRGAPLSPGPPYLSAGLGPGGAMYPAMNIYGVAIQGVASNGIENGSSDEYSGWGDNRNQISPYPQNSPQISAQGIPIPYVPGMPPRNASASGRSYSFEETMLTPSVESQQDQYTMGHISPGSATPGTLFTHQAWGYVGPPADMYGASASPLQPRPTMPYGTMHVGPPRHHGPPTMGPYGGQFYPATSPGPPIQTTPSNKGPDGANLFIFHIPNHFTNLDMYQLFCPYGNLLSVRIMVEKDTGRSRGFGFVSYDSPESAALAIKELNGFAIGNKRLKVQHKQIRPGDQHLDRSLNSGYDNPMEIGYVQGMAPSGPMVVQSNDWYGQQGGSMPEDYEVTPDQQPYDGTDGPVETADASSGSDPLSGMEPLRQALPDDGNNNNSN